MLEHYFFRDAKNEVSLVLAGSEGSVIIRTPSERSFPDSDNLGIDIWWSNNNCFSCTVFLVTISVKELRLKQNCSAGGARECKLGTYRLQVFVGTVQRHFGCNTVNQLRTAMDDVILLRTLNHHGENTEDHVHILLQKLEHGHR